MGVFLRFGSLVAAILLTLSLLLLYHQIPRYNGTIEVGRNSHGKSSRVQINRSSYGIPTVQGDNFEDVSYGIGYAHAQDRLWSMHFKRRLCEGRLSEITGRQTLRMDMLSRELQLDPNALAKYNNQPKHIQDILISYANGVNDYVASLPMLPIEFQILGDSFYKWLPHSSLSLINLMSLFLTLEMAYEPFRQQLSEKYGEELAKMMLGADRKFNFEMTSVIDDEDLIRMGLSREPETTANKPRDFHVSETLLKSLISNGIVELLDEVSKGIQGSNAWVVSGNHTTTGKPLLANDPHLETMIPSIWYQTEIVITDNADSKKNTQVIGATLPGLPFIMIGRNSYLAWGVTNNILDNSDYYVEKIKDGKYFFDDKWIPLKQKNETINVRFEGSYSFTQQQTHHGPIVSGLFNLIDPTKEVILKEVVSMCWIGHIENDSALESLYDMMFIRKVEEIQPTLRLVKSSNLNIIYATTDNHIGYYAQGRLPIKEHPNTLGFRDGTDPRNDWISFVSESEQPRLTNPKRGFIVSANNNMASDKLLNNVNAGQISIPRARRITDLLSQGIAAGKKFSTADFQEMQRDVLDVYASYITGSVVDIFTAKAETYIQDKEKLMRITSLVNQHLRTWDYRLTKDSVGASLYMAWEHYFLQSYLHEFDESDSRTIVSMCYMFDHFFLNEITAMLEAVKNGSSFERSYCAIPIANSNGDCVKNIVTAFVEGIDHLTQKYGNDDAAASWSWGAVHKHRFDHKPFSKTPLKAFFERSYIGEGNRRTINVGGVNHHPDNWDSWYSPNYRQVIDLSENNDSYFIIDTGISENIFSKHYDDQMNLHREGKAVTMKFSSQQPTLKPTYQLTIIFKSK